jgi:hypothetical protein
VNDEYGYQVGSRLKQLLSFFAVIVVIFCAYLIVSAIITAETTGLLKVSGTQKATISITKTGSQAKIVGKPGKAKIRLKPGTYQVVASGSNGQGAARQISIQKKKSTTLSLTLANSPKLPSVSSVSFFGMSALTDIGITTDQMNALKFDFFRFKTSANAVSVNTKSIQTLPYILGNPSVSTFTVTVDSQTYNAKISFADLFTVQLVLSNPKTGQQVFDSSNLSRPSIAD